MKEILSLIERVLPTEVSKTGLQYNQSSNMLVATAYTSIAGNTYFKGIRLSDKIYLALDIGIGYARVFLNKLTIYTTKNKKVIASKSYHCNFYNEAQIKEEAKKMVKEELVKEAKKDNLILDEQWVSTYVEGLIEDTNKGQIQTLMNMQADKLLAR